MIFKTTNDIMLTGLTKFSKEFNANETQQAQILVAMLEDQSIQYQKAFDWQPKGIVKFTEIMNKPFDLLGFQSLARPIMQQSIVGFAAELNIAPTNCFVFIFEQNKIVYLAIYNGSDYIRHITLKEHLSNLGLE